MVGTVSGTVAVRRGSKGARRGIDVADPLGLWSAPSKQGCDFIPDYNPCMAKCCDEHDRCFEQAKGYCTMMSVFYKTDTDCDTCNRNVFKCAWKAIGLGPGGGRKGCPP